VGNCKGDIIDNCDGLDTELLANYRLSQLDSQPVQPPAELPAPSLVAPSPSESLDKNRSVMSGDGAIPLLEQGGTLVVPVKINDALTLNFIVDSGSADVRVPADVVMTLIRLGTITTSDFIGKQTYRLADGSEAPSDTFRIRRLTVGGREVVNVTGSIAGVEGSLLLGQSFLSRFKSWSIDNNTHRLLLQEY
jgi:predicted aspartyl protease